MERFLPSLLPTLNENAKLIVADNASSDQSTDWLQEKYDSIEIIQNGSNLGFAEGYNQALNGLEASYYLLLNSDVEVTPGWLEPLVAAMDSNPQLGACQPKILWEKEKTRFEYSGAAGGFIDVLGYPFCRGRIFGTLELDHGQYDQACEIFWASGACLMVRADVFRKANGFDGDFFAHMEEIDLCWRIRNLGYSIQCIPSSTVYHVGGATLPKNNARKTFLNFRNNLSMLWKNLPASQLPWVIFLRLILDGVAGIKFITEGHFKDCMAVIKAHFSFYYRIITGKLVRASGEKKIHETVLVGSLVWQHYVMGIKKFSDLKFKIRN
jgi:GT2 family glycosyltransferase